MLTTDSSVSDEMMLLMTMMITTKWQQHIVHSQSFCFLPICLLIIRTEDAMHSIHSYNPSTETCTLNAMRLISQTGFACVLFKL